MARRKHAIAVDAVVLAARQVLEAWSFSSGLAINIGRLADAMGALDASLPAIQQTPGSFVEGSPETSRFAAFALVNAKSHRRKIAAELYSVRGYGYIGLCDFQLEARLKDKHQTISSARNWLMEAGWVIDSGMRFKNPESNRPCIIWSLTPAAIAALDAEYRRDDG